MKETGEFIPREAPRQKDRISSIVKAGAIFVGLSGIGMGAYLNGEAINDLSAMAAKQKAFSQEQINTDKLKGAGGGMLIVLSAMGAISAVHRLGEKSK